MKCEISEEEWYPVITLSGFDERWGAWRWVDVPDDLKEEYDKTLSAFKDLQGKLKPYFEKSETKNPSSNPAKLQAARDSV